MMRIHEEGLKEEDQAFVNAHSGDIYDISNWCWKKKPGFILKTTLYIPFLLFSTGKYQIQLKTIYRFPL